jgi:hypothetical protein
MTLSKFKEINWDPSIQERIKLGRLLLMGFPFAAVFWTTLMGFRGPGFHWHWEIFCWIAGIGCGIGLFCLLFPIAARPIYCLWYFLVCVIDTVLTTTLLTLFYYFIMTPLAAMIRGFRKNSMKVKPEECETYWKEVEPNQNQAQYYRQF